MNYKTMNIADIINWCEKNHQQAWLKETAAKTYPAYDKKGKLITRRITFIELKLAFVQKFMPEIAPKKKAPKPSMYDLINSL